MRGNIPMSGKGLWANVWGFPRTDRGPSGRGVPDRGRFLFCLPIFFSVFLASSSPRSVLFLFVLSVPFRTFPWVFSLCLFLGSFPCVLSVSPLSALSSHHPSSLSVSIYRRPIPQSGSAGISLLECLQPSPNITLAGRASDAPRIPRRIRPLAVLPRPIDSSFPQL